ncbi:hypothetical protein AYL99_02879 [Fonsecaea erecta]|uniref:Cns1/TTC4 wheel domain-containing protein n=1 Tax=Fonsecaea erecta TaxID=1367422 RepID=A0A178ZVC5_9EURO|nr:hypothetical protein AYL99_02879 [Fonsecaea erecta]OAP63652.1 hypothetical protein AYL99_02879 [Fonsecaea erecta]
MTLNKGRSWLYENHFKTIPGGYAVCVDHIFDFISLSAYDERVPDCWKPKGTESIASFNDWNTKGNDLYEESKYRAAIKCYTKALDCSSTAEETDAPKINRARAFLRTNRFEAALRDPESLSSLQKAAEESLFYKAQALYSLQRFRECSKVLETICLEGLGYPENLIAKDQCARTIHRLAEQESAGYSFEELRTEAAKLQPPLLDRATYVGPVYIRPSASRGRGLFTTKAVKASDLLLYAGDLKMLLNLETDTVNVGAQSELIKQIVQKLYRNPSLAPVFTNLHHGSYKLVNVSEVDGAPVVDTFLVERIINLNSFGCSLPSRESHLRTAEDPDSMPGEDDE